MQSPPPPAEAETAIPDAEEPSGDAEEQPGPEAAESGRDQEQEAKPTSLFGMAAAAVAAVGSVRV